jgi:SET domain-containing protein
MRSYSVLIDSADHYLHRIAFFTIRDVDVGEELTFHYGGRFDTPNTTTTKRGRRPRKRSRASDPDENFFKCFCGEPNCLRRIQYRYDQD